MTSTSASMPTCHLLEPLTVTEEKVLFLLAQGMSDKEIGLELSLAPITIRGNYKQNIYDKLGLQPGFRNRKWAVHCARQVALLPGGGEELDMAPPGDNPYKGLDAFHQEDAPVFFGREVLVEQLLTRLNQNGSTPRFLAVVGPSGCGKSSVVRAGLIPALRQDKVPGAATWAVATMFPRINPFFELETTLRAVATKPQPDLLDLLQRDSYGLARASRLILSEDQALLLVIDQFEEVFTLVEDSALARRFMDSLYAAVTDPRSTVRVVITLRADFLDRPLMYPDFSWLVQKHTVMVVPLTPDELERAITLPAQQAHIAIESGLVARLVAEANEQPGALPLLEFALTELYDNRIGRTITMSSYEETGGLQQALAAQADKIYAGLSHTQQEAGRQLFLRLITLGEGTEDVRRRVPMRELAALGAQSEAIDYVIQFLAANRLLTLDLDPVTKEPLVEVAHEALIREWRKLREWLDESRNDVRMERLLATAVEEWHQHDREESYLMGGAKLAQFEGWREASNLALTEAENKFLSASVAERDRQRRRRRMIRNLVLATTLLAAAMMAVLAITATRERNRAEDAEQDALRQASIGLAAQAVAEIESDTPERGVLLALEALENYPYTPQAERALAQTVYATHPYTDLSGIAGTVNETAFSPDGTRVASVTDEYDVVIWDVAREKGPSLIGDYYQGAEERVSHQDVAWSPDGVRLATVTAFTEDTVVDGGLIKIWDTSTGANLATWSGHDGESIWAVAWANDSQTIITGGADHLLRIWRTDTWEEVRRLSGHTGDVRDVALSPDGDLIASASADNSVRIWDIQTGELLQVLSGHLSAVNAVDWSPDGSRLLSAGDDGITILWNAASGEIRRTLVGHTGAVLDMAWSSDAMLAATASADGTVRIWDVTSGLVIVMLQGNTRGLAWSSGGERLVIGFGVAGLRMWDMSQRPLRLVGHETDMLDGEWSPNGSFIVTGSFDGTARVWDTETGENTLIFLNHKQEGANTVAGEINFAPDSKWVATHGGDLNTRVWNIETGEERFVFPIFGGNKFSPDGSKLAIFGDERAIVVDWATGEILLDFDPGFGGPCFVTRISWSPNGRYIVTPCYEQARADIWDAQTGDLLRTLPHENGVNPTGWSPDGTRIITAGIAGVVHIWDAASGELLFNFRGHTASIWDADWSPDGQRIASSDDTGMILIWDAATGQVVNSYNVGFGPLNVSWSSDGTQLIAAGLGSSVPDIRPVWQTTEELIAYARGCCVWRGLTLEERAQFGLAEPES